jgi:hypothetical protein
MPTTTGMKGAGYYDQHSGPQLSGIQLPQPWVEEAVAKPPLPPAPRRGRGIIAYPNARTEVIHDPMMETHPAGGIR